jgi:hypothetical protein
MRRFARAAVAIILFICASARAADRLPQVFSCAKQGTVGGLGAGTDLARFVIDTETFPEAVCNDGTPGIFYYAPATKVEDRNKWIIFLQGGGSCRDGQSCAERWCSVDTNYGFDKMTSSVSKPAIRGQGFMDPAPKNRFGSWNRVLIFYCSSDTWAGTSTRTTTGALNGGPPREFEIYFRGSRIIDAVIDTLRYAAPAPSRRRVVRHERERISPRREVEPAATPWPDLDLATDILFAGSSAGGEGARSNMDRVGAKLRAVNPGVAYRGLIDAAYGTLSDRSDFTRTTYCANDPVRGCSYETFTQATYQEVHVNFEARRGDESCQQWHSANLPGTEWRCGDAEHVNQNHLTTPFFIHQDLQDTQVGGTFVDPNFGTPSDFARRVEDELRNMEVPEEPRGAMPGLFLPQCTDHESFTNDSAVFQVKIDGRSYHDAVWNWWTGAVPQQLIRHFTGTPGKAPECP